MKPMLLSSLAVTLLAAAGTMSVAQAQEWNEREVYHDQRGYHQEPSTYRQERDFGLNARYRSVDERLDQQRERIAQGIQSGQITWREARALRAERRAIRAKERAYLADGRLDRFEWQDLQRDLRQASRNIYQATHDYDWRG